MSLSPYLAAKDAAAALEFYKQAFGAVENYRLNGPDGRIGHAEFTINGARLMIADEYPDFGALSPQTIGGSPIKLHIYVDNADATIAQAVKAGATLVREPKDEFFGDRSGMVTDPFGYSWFVAHKIEEVSPEEMQRRWDEGMGE